MRVRLLMHTTIWNLVARAGLVASTCLVVSCSPVPKLVPHVARLELGEQIKQATLIVVGVAEDERAMRTAASELKEGSMPLQLRAVRIRVERALKGRFDGERLTFYYYQTTGAWDGPPSQSRREGLECCVRLEVLPGRQPHHPPPMLFSDHSSDAPAFRIVPPAFFS
jgi:hypothetical protein